MFLGHKNKRTRGMGECFLVWNENMRFGWALPNTRWLRFAPVHLILYIELYIL